jgi:hypothetical protein
MHLENHICWGQDCNKIWNQLSKLQVYHESEFFCDTYLLKFYAYYYYGTYLLFSE